MTVSAVVVSHRHAADLERLLPALLRQVDEVVVVANVAGSVPTSVPPGVDVVENTSPLPLSANVNRGVAMTRGEYVLNVNPDAIPDDGAVAALSRVLDEHPRAGIAGPAMLWPDGTRQPSRRRFPTGGGTGVRRTPPRKLRGPDTTQRG